MAEPGRLCIDQLVPGGIRLADHLHVGTNDGTCSRCRAPVPEGQAPLMLWTSDGFCLYIFCEGCLRPEPAAPVREGAAHDER